MAQSPRTPQDMQEPERTLILPSGSAPPPPARKRSTARTVLTIVIIVVAVALLLFVADRLAQGVAERAAGNRLQTELATPTPPAVDVGGFPFLSQVASGSFSSVHVVADEMVVPDQNELTLEHLDLTLRDVEATDRYQSVVAGQAEATALMDYENLGELAQVPMEFDGDGKVRVQFSVPIGRLSIRGSVAGRPVLDAEAQTITIEDPDVDILSVNVPSAVVDAVSRIVLEPIPLADLPYGIVLTSLSVAEEGVQVSGTASDVRLR